MRLTRTTTAAVLLCFAAGSSNADIVVATYSGPNSFLYEVTQMTDLDQLRTSLPNDGKMYCSPTSVVNMLAYAANHGFPAVYPLAGDWQAQSNFTLGSLAISVTGTLMGTDPVEGTNGAGTKNAVKKLLWQGAHGNLCYQMAFSGPKYRVRLATLAKAAANGGIARFAYGRYPVFGPQGDSLLVAPRDGGHCVTLDGAGPSAPFAPYYVTYRDPADKGTASLTQSAFMSVVTDVHTVSVVSGFQGIPYLAESVLWAPGGSSGPIRLIDEMLVIRPAGALSFSQAQGSFTLVPSSAGSLGKVPAPVPLGTGIYGMADLAYDFDALDAIALVVTSPTSGATQLRRVDIAAGTQAPIGSLTSLRRIAVGRDARIYAHDGSTVRAIAPDGTVEASTARVASPTALAYDDLSDRVFVLSVPSRRLTRLTPALEVEAAFDIPSAAVMGGDGSIAAGTEDGAAYFVTDASAAVCRLGPGWGAADFSMFSVSGISLPRSIAAADGGRLYVSSQGTVRSMIADGSGRWAQDPTAPFHGMADPGRIAFMRSRDNYEPTVHGTAAWRELRIEELAAGGTVRAGCDADLNTDGRVDGADLGILLGAWGATRLESVRVTFDYAGNASGSWASDLVLTVSDGTHPAVSWGGYDSLLGGSVDAGEWPFAGAGSAASGRYTATVAVPAGAALSGGGPWTATVGNGWTNSPAVQYRDVVVEPAGRGMPPSVPVGGGTFTGGQSTATAFPTAPVSGDLNHDGTVDGADLGILLGAWGACVR